jgi:DNA-directed RNA polymerase specialized sigma subunit, sigma24 homolog
MLALYLSILDTDAERDKMTSIYEHNHLFCISIAMKVTGNMAMAEDAVHNAFLEIIKRKEKYFALDGSVLRASLVIIVKNKSIDLLRERKKIADDPIDGVEG